MRRGRDILYEDRFGDGEFGRLPELAGQLARARVDVICAVGPAAIQAAKHATTTIPIVMAFSGDDPVRSEFVTSLARPGGNLTGITLDAGIEIGFVRHDGPFADLGREFVTNVDKFASWLAALLQSRSGR